MSKFVLILILSASIIGCQNKHTSNLNELSVEDTRFVNNPSKLEMLDTFIDIGKMEQGEKRKVSFRFKNVGNSDMLLLEVRPSCGCTIADYPKKPFKPGEEGVFTAEFNSAGKLGRFAKSIEVFSSTIPTSHIVRFEGEIFTKK